MGFRIGQDVVCINPVGWESSLTLAEVRGPANGEVCTIAGFEDIYLMLEGYEGVDSFDPAEFRPLLTDFEEVIVAEAIEELMCEPA